MPKKILLLLIIIILIASFFRLYRISEYMSFLGDEGRDVLIAKEILNREPKLLGPRSSAGDFYMGPLYYYLISPFLLLANYDPIGPAIMVALFGVATTVLIYVIGSQFFNRQSGLFAAALYSIAPLVLVYSRSSWNPNILPFFSLLLIYLTWITVTKNKSWHYYLFLGLLLGFCLQLHYLSLFLGVTIMIFIILNSGKIKILELIRKNALIAFGTLISISPLILFDFLHNFLNTRGIYSFIFAETLPGKGDSHYFQIVGEVFFRLFARLIFNYPTPENPIRQGNDLLIFIWGAVALIIAVSSIFLLFKRTQRTVSRLLGLWLIISILLFGLYKKEIHDYLFAFLFPLPFLLVGNLLSQIYNFAKSRHKKIISITVSLMIFSGIIAIYLIDIPFRHAPNNQRGQTKTISEFILRESENQPINFALISGGNSDHAYRYFLDILGNPPVIINNFEADPKRETVTKQLFIVCEQTDCQPLGHPLFDIAAYGRAEIEDSWNVSVVKIYKLIPYLENSQNNSTL